MKKIILILALFPLCVFAANDGMNSRTYTSDSCANTTDPALKRECLDAEKNKEAARNFENFEENTPSSYQENF
jgi:hypothetical protein